MEERRSNRSGRRRPPATRRAVLAAVAGAMPALAGCNGLGSGETDPDEDDDSEGDGSVPGVTDDGAASETATETETDRFEDPDRTPNPEPFEVVHWWTAGGEKEALQALLDGYKNEYGYEINNNPAPGGAASAQSSKIKSRVRGGDPPSTFQIWPGKALKPYSGAGLLADIGEAVWSDDMRSNYPEGVKRLSKRQGAYVAVPLDVHRLNNLFYNASVLEWAGVDPSSIGNQQDLVDAMETVERETEAVGMAHQTAFNWSTVQLWETVFLAREGRAAFLDLVAGNASAHRTGIERALRTVDAFSEFFFSDAASISWDEANARLMDNRAAFVHQGDWAAGQYRADADFTFGEDWNHMAYPGTEGVYSLVMDSFVKPTDNPTPVKTDDFLSYCGTTEAQVRFNVSKGAIPPRTDAPRSEFEPFRRAQMASYARADSHLPTITHGSGLAAPKKRKVAEAFARFIENYDVERTTGALVDAIGG